MFRNARKRVKGQGKHNIIMQRFPELNLVKCGIFLLFWTGFDFVVVVVVFFVRSVSIQPTENKPKPLCSMCIVHCITHWPSDMQIEFIDIYLELDWMHKNNRNKIKYWIELNFHQAKIGRLIILHSLRIRMYI